MIKSISYSQDEILEWITSIYGDIEIDLTYSKGNFYKNIKEPKFKFDLNPLKDEIKANSEYIPLKDNSISTIMYDPPFLATTGKSLKIDNDSNKINKRFGVAISEKDLLDMYFKTLEECYRILKPNGYLYFKCQDKVSSGKQYWSHISIYNKAVELGFYGKDLFILLAKNRLVANWQLKQQHARKFHSYFWVLKKGK